MTYKEFLKTYRCIDNFTDEQALEGTHYLRAIYDGLDGAGRRHLAKGIVVLHSYWLLTLPSIKDMENHPAWIRAILGLVCEIVYTRQTQTHYLCLDDTVPRSADPWMIGAEIKEYKKPKIY
jgi:hypothetical protein